MTEIQTVLIQIGMAALGTLGFSLYFHIRLRNLPAGMIGGVGGWAFYLLIFHLSGSVLLSSMAASFLVCIWAEVMARVMKAPVNVFMIPGLIPLIPGGGLYDTMHAVVDGDMEAFKEKGTQTGLTMIGIVVGIIGASVVFLYIAEWIAASKKHKANRAEKKRRKAGKKDKNASCEATDATSEEAAAEPVKEPVGN